MDGPAAGDLLPGSLGWSVVGAVWTWLLALVLGASILRAAKAGPPVSDLLSWAVVGMALQSYAWLLLSALGLLHSTNVVLAASALSVIGVVLGHRPVVAAVRGIRLDGGGRGEPAWLKGAALGCLVLLLLITFRLAVLPSAYCDDLVYHLGLPRQALLIGSWPALPEFHPGFMPATWEIAYVLPLSLGGGSGPQLMNTIALGLLALVAYRIARLGAGPAAAMAGTAILLACPLFLGLGSLASNDLFAGLAIAVALDRLCVTAGQRPVEIGLIAGAAWATKFTALPAVVALAIGAAMLSPGAPSRRVGRMAVVGLGAALVGLGWTVRAVVLTGNPLYPAFFDALGGRHWSALAASLLTRDSSLGAMPTNGLAAFLFAPVEVARTAGGIGSPAGVNLVFIGLALLGFLLARHVRDVWVLLVFLAVAYVGWVATSLMVRFAIPILIALLPFAAIVIERAWKLGTSRADLTNAVAALLLLCIVTAPVMQGIDRELARFGPHMPFWGGAERSDLLSSRIRLAAAGRSMAASLPREARILMIGDGRLALLPRPAVASTAIDEPAVNRYLVGAQTVSELEERLARDFTHVVVNYRELKRLASDYAFIDRLPAGGRRLLVEYFSPARPMEGRWGEVSLYRLPHRGLAEAGGFEPP